jgi:hypothetical protein
MWDRIERPNWIGEFGTTGDTFYPELFHHAIWGALASGASMTPAEWNSGGAWGRMTPEMSGDVGRLAQFVSDMPLAEWNPSKLKIVSGEPGIRAWGMAGNDGGLFWVQDYSLEGSPIADIRSETPVRTGVEVTLQSMPAGSYSIQPYDTWQGIYLEEIDVQCEEGQSCVIALPDFISDMAFKILRP